MLKHHNLTHEGFQQLNAELEYLLTVRRAEVAERLREALDSSDPVSDGEYDAAKQEQAFLEGRIASLQKTLATARIIDPQGQRSSDQVAPGCRVTIQEAGCDPETFQLVGPAEADSLAGKISDASPLGQALLDHRTGDEVVVLAPGGSYRVRILGVAWD